MNKFKDLTALIKEAITMSPEYAKKEKVRQDLQNYITSLIAQKVVQNDHDLKQFFSDLEKDSPLGPVDKMAINALRMIPFDVFKKIT